jgi:hypothetical protein
MRVGSGLGSLEQDSAECVERHSLIQYCNRWKHWSEAECRGICSIAGANGKLTLGTTIRGQLVFGDCVVVQKSLPVGV